jgi:DNA-binding NarL/FixJ family response regulator
VISSTDRIRVLIADVPDVFAYMLTDLISAQPDMALVGSVKGSLHALLTASQGADVVILGTQLLNSPPGVISHLLNAFPFIKVLLLSPEEDAALGFWLGVRRYSIKPLSGETILMDVRKLHALAPTV